MSRMNRKKTHTHTHTCTYFFLRSMDNKERDRYKINGRRVAEIGRNTVSKHQIQPGYYAYSLPERVDRSGAAKAHHGAAVSIFIVAW